MAQPNCQIGLTPSGCAARLRAQLARLGQQILDPPLLGELVKTVFDKMQLAGEAGTLLKIEEEIRAAIDQARKEALRQRGDLYEHANATEEAFFDTAEERIYTALEKYAESAEAGDYQRRLFAEDAAHGFAFIDLCRKRYDAVVTMRAAVIRLKPTSFSAASSMGITKLRKAGG